jgi:hypothetical protein
MPGFFRKSDYFKTVSQEKAAWAEDLFRACTQGEDSTKTF